MCKYVRKMKQRKQKEGHRETFKQTILSPFTTKDFHLCFVSFFLICFFLNLDWHCSVSVFIKYNSALRR